MRRPAHRILLGLLVLVVLAALGGCFTSSFHGSVQTNATVTNNSLGSPTDK